MADTNKKKGFLGKFFTVLSGKPTDAEENEQNSLTYGSSKKEPVDLSFVKNFTASGGKFLYCENEKDAYHYLEQIIPESGLNGIFCQNSNLEGILTNAGLKDYIKPLTEADAFCSSCEYLISFNGGIMITAKQTLGKKLDELPETFITIAKTSQILENLRAGLTGIRNKYKGDIPSQITTIKGPIKSSNPDATQGAICSKEIYLLLIEDQITE